MSSSSLDGLPSELLCAIVSNLTTTSRGRIGCVTRRFKSIAADPVVWETAEVEPTAIHIDRALAVIGKHTMRLRVRNKQRGICRQRFGAPHLQCHHQPPSNHQHCNCFQDAGAALVLRSCPELRELEFPGMRQLTSATLVAIMQRTPSLTALNLRGCVSIATGFADAAAAVGLSEHHKIRHLDLSHVAVVDDDVVALLDRLPCLESLQVNFCSALTDAVLDALPTTIQRVEALGCERFSWDRMEALRQELGPTQLRCDDTEILSIGSNSHGGGDMARSLMQMLMSYRAEEMRRE